MEIQDLVREKVIGNIKIGQKGENGLPKKLSFFNVEEDKSTTSEIVDIFKKMYPDKPTKLRIRFVSENPFNFKFKRYVNGKAVCIGNDSKAITIGKDEKNRNTQIEVDCNEGCEHRRTGKCKLKGSLKFVLDGINAGGVWNISTSGGYSLSNIASEIMKYKKANMSIVNVPFELSLSEQESLAYGVYYSIDLKRTDIKPELVSNTTQLLEGKVDKEQSAGPKKATKELQESKKIENSKAEPKTETTAKQENKDKANWLMLKEIGKININNIEFNKLVFEDINTQTVEYVLHPKAKQEILLYGVGTVIELISSKIESGYNIICKYNIKEYLDENNQMQELKEAV